MKLFEIDLRVPIEKLEQAILSACTPHKTGDLSADYDDTYVVVRDYSTNEAREPRTMAMIRDKLDHVFEVYIWGVPRAQEEIMSDFLKYLDIKEEDVRMKR